MKKYAIVYKLPDYEIKFYEYLGPYQLWAKICTVENDFYTILKLMKIFYS